LTSERAAFITIHGLKVYFMPSLLHSVQAAHLITAIVRMLGKAVKLRHCPATVSAPAFTAVVSAAAGSQYGHLRLFKVPNQPLETRPLGWLWEGAGKGASQETGPRRPKQPACVPRGTKELP
jgi:hypothetical protein